MKTADQTEQLHAVLVSFRKLQDDIKKQKEKSLAFLKSNNPEKIVLSWGWEDVQAIRPGWDKKRCLKTMLRIGKWLKDSMTEQGWEQLGIAVDLDEVEQNKEGKE